VLKFRAVILDKFDGKGSYFEVKVKSSLGLKRKKSSCVISASELPMSVGIVSATRLKHSNRSKLL